MTTGARAVNAPDRLTAVPNAASTTPAAESAAA
jgi:hypothetical protein